jgi:AcrR family transcriptional regulator
MLSQNGAARLEDIAVAANVGCTTVDRYFPERSDLLAAISLLALEQIAAATQRARLNEGRADAALTRLCEEYFELGDMLMLVFNEPQVMGKEWEEDSEADCDLRELIERGHAEGSIDKTLGPVWLQSVLWALLYSSWEYVGRHSASKHEALSQCLYSLRKVISPTS